MARVSQYLRSAIFQSKGFPGKLVLRSFLADDSYMFAILDKCAEVPSLILLKIQPRVAFSGRDSIICDSIRNSFLGSPALQIYVASGFNSMGRRKNAFHKTVN